MCPPGTCTNRWRVGATRCAACQQAKPNRREAAQLIREAELWLLRIRLFRSHALRLVRWHAIGAM